MKKLNNSIVKTYGHFLLGFHAAHELLHWMASDKSRCLLSFSRQYASISMSVSVRVWARVCENEYAHEWDCTRVCKSTWECASTCAGMCAKINRRMTETVVVWWPCFGFGYRSLEDMHRSRWSDTRWCAATGCLLRRFISRDNWAFHCSPLPLRQSAKSWWWWMVRPMTVTLIKQSDA